jgi:hypothetical protein
VWLMEDWYVVDGGLVCVRWRLGWLMEDGCVVDGALVCDWCLIGV